MSSYCVLSRAQIFFASIKTGGVSQIYIMDLGSSTSGAAMFPAGVSAPDGAFSAVGSPEQNVLAAGAGVASSHNPSLPAQFSLALAGADDDAL